MKKLLTVLFACFLALAAHAQTHTFPALDTNNPFTGQNTFNGTTFFPGIGTGCLQVTGGTGQVSTINCSSPAIFPSTPGIVFNTTTTASRNATASDIETVLGFTPGTATIAHTTLIVKGDNAGNAIAATAADITTLLGYVPGHGGIATTPNILKGDNAGNAIAATAGTDYPGFTANTFTGAQTYNVGNTFNGTNLFNGPSTGGSPSILFNTPTASNLQQYIQFQDNGTAIWNVVKDSVNQFDIGSVLSGSNPISITPGSSGVLRSNVVTFNTNSVIMASSSNANTYFNVQNTSNGASAGAGLVLTNDQSIGIANLTLRMNSSGYGSGAGSITIPNMAVIVTPSNDLTLATQGASASCIHIEPDSGASGSPDTASFCLTTTTVNNQFTVNSKTNAVNTIFTSDNGAETIIDIRGTQTGVDNWQIASQSNNHLTFDNTTRGTSLALDIAPNGNITTSGTFQTASLNATSGVTAGSVTANASIIAGVTTATQSGQRAICLNSSGTCLAAGGWVGISNQPGDPNDVSINSLSSFNFYSGSSLVAAIDSTGHFVSTNQTGITATGTSCVITTITGGIVTAGHCP